jgi:hypothetical protein
MQLTELASIDAIHSSFVWGVIDATWGTVIEHETHSFSHCPNNGFIECRPKATAF